LTDESTAAVLRLAHELCSHDQLRWLAYELVCHHAAFDTLRRREIEELGRGFDSWWTVVDGAGRYHAGLLRAE
jgi:hypothetical protein